jgi:uncharacterized protein YecE (DUF72 family)
MSSLYVGTSGFSYTEWKPDFYPASMKSADFLEHYATLLTSVEINNTFYRSPTEALLKGWVDKTPEDFRFTLKAPQRITHRARLRDVDEELSFFLNVAKVLDTRLGMILFQCPPNLRYEPELLDAFLAALPGEPFRFAMEFRHVSWNTDEVREKLTGGGVAWCVAETEGEHPMVRTARGFVYLRLRKDEYTDEDLARWAKEVRSVLDDGADVYAYFKHEDDARAPAYARTLMTLCAPQI